MEWFKFRMCWCGPLLKMRDEEIGQLVRALLTFVLTEEEQEISGRGEIFLCEIVEILREDIRQFRENDEKKEAIRKKRRESGRKGAMARWEQPEDDSKASCLLSGDDVCHTGLEVANVCHDLPGKNKKQNKNKKKNSETEKETDTEAESEEESYSCSEPPSAVSELPAAEIPLNDGSEYPLYRRDLDEYASLYPSVDIEQEMRNIRGWCLANPTRRKTRLGIRRFINGWLSREQDRGRAKPDVPENPFLSYARGEKDIGDFLL